MSRNPFLVTRMSYEMEKRPTQLDAHIDVITPENIAFHYEAAGPFRRLPAYLIDVMIRILVLTAFFFWHGDNF